MEQPLGEGVSDMGTFDGELVRASGNVLGGTDGSASLCGRIKSFSSTRGHPPASSWLVL